MFENLLKFFKKFSKENNKDSKDTAKERLHLVLMQDRANVSADFLEMMKQEIIEVIKKYIDVDENSIDVKLTNKVNSDGTTGAPALYANIPIVSLKDETKNINIERKNVNNNEENDSINKEEASTKNEEENEIANNNEVQKTEEKIIEEVKEEAKEVTESNEPEKEEEDKQEKENNSINNEEDTSTKNEEVEDEKVSVSEVENKE